MPTLGLMKSKFLLATFLLLRLVVFGQHTNPGQDAVFRPNEVAVIKLTLAPEAKAFLLDPANAESEEYFPADFQMMNSQMDTLLADKVGVRLRGNTSRNHVKKGFKIDFREYEGGKFYDYKKFNLKPNVNDPSHLREPLSLLYYREMNVPAARTHPLQLYVNEEYMGVYTNIEQVDDEFLNKRHGHEDGFLYKCAYGANLLDNGQVFNTTLFESELNNAEDTRAELDHFVEVLNTTSNANFKTEIEKVFDVDTYLKQLAVEALLGHWDGYSYNQNNYYLFYNGVSKKVEFFPYDADNTWGIDWVNGDWATRNLTQWYKTNEARPLTSRILQVEEYRLAYIDHLRTLLEVYFQEAYLYPLLDAYKALLAPAVLADTYFSRAFGFTYPDFLASFSTGMNNHVEYGIQEYLEERTRTAIEQIPSLVTSVEHNENPEVVVYPNPAREPILYLRSPNGSAPELLVFTSTGVPVTISVQKQDEVTAIYLPAASPTGLYFVRYNSTVLKWVWQ